MIYLRIAIELAATMAGNLGLAGRRSMIAAGVALAAVLAISLIWAGGLLLSRNSSSVAGLDPATTVSEVAPFAPVSTVVSGNPTQVAAGTPTAGAGQGGAINTGSPRILGNPARAETIRSIQNALRDAGCYDGATNGYWSTKTRDGMKRLLVVLNEPLPVDQPDPALAALLASNPAARCDGTVGNPVSPPTTPQTNAAVAPPVRRPALDTVAVRPAPAEPIASETKSSENSAVLASAVAGGAVAAVGAAAVGSAVGSTVGSDDAAAEESRDRRRRSSSASSSNREEASRPARRTSRRKTATAFDGVSRTMNRNFRSLSRSLSSLFR